MFRKGICKFYPFTPKKGHGEKEPICMFVCIRCHKLPGGHDLVTGWSAFRPFLLCPARMALPCSWASSRTNFLNKQLFFLVLYFSLTLFSSFHTTQPYSWVPSEARDLCINTEYISDYDSGFIPQTVDIAFVFVPVPPEANPETAIWVQVVPFGVDSRKHCQRKGEIWWGKKGSK